MKSMPCWMVILLGKLCSKWFKKILNHRRQEQKVLQSLIHSGELPNLIAAL